MSIFKKAMLLVLSLSLLLTVLPTSSHALPNAPALSVSAQSAILIEATSGRTVYQKDAQKRLPMASTTKIMTALTALMEASADLLITVDERAVGIEGSSVYLTEGETLTLESLLYALLLESANDAAAAIAIGVCGSMERFVEQMNAHATALGLTDTRFQNPHGLDAEEHYTTATDLARLTRAALEKDLLKRIVSTRKTTIPHDGEEGVRLLVNHNRLLRAYEGCIGVKTGYTQRSGRCLVSAAERDGVTLIAVTLNAPDDWSDHTRMLDHGFSRFHARTLCGEEALLYPLPIVGGKDSYVMLGNREAVTVTLPRDASAVETVFECRRFEYAGVTEGEILGRAVFRLDTDGDGVKEVIGECPLSALYTVQKQEPKNKFWAWLTSLFQ